MHVSKTWKLTSSIEITVLDGKIQLVGQGFVKELDALTTGTCKSWWSGHFIGLTW